MLVLHQFLIKPRTFTSTQNLAECGERRRIGAGGGTIKGIYGREMYETWYKMTVMLQSGLDISPVITHRFHYTEFEKGFEVMSSGNAGKVILNWE